MNLKELKDYIVRKLQENNTPEYWGVSEIEDAINDGYAEFVRITKLLTDRVVTSSPSIGYYKFPDDAQEILNVYWNGKPLTPVSINQLNRGAYSRDYAQDNYYYNQYYNKYPLDSTGEPLFWTVVNSLIRLVPFDDSDSEVMFSSVDGIGLLMSDEFGIVLPYSTDEDLLLESEDEYFGGISSLISLTDNCMIEYVKYPERLVNDTNIPDIPLSFHISLAYYALHELFSREGTEQDLNKAMFYYNRFKEYCYRGKNFFKSRTPKINMPFYV